MEEGRPKRRDAAGEAAKNRSSRTNREQRDCREQASESSTAASSRGDRRRAHAFGDDVEPERRHSKGHLHRSHRSERFDAEGRGDDRSERERDWADRDRDRDRERDRERDRGRDHEHERELEPEDRGDVRRVHIVQRSSLSGHGGQQPTPSKASLQHRQPTSQCETAIGRAAIRDAKKKPQFSILTPTPAFIRCKLAYADGRFDVDDARAVVRDSGAEFTVVGCVGKEGAGKSTVLSLMLPSLADSDRVQRPTDGSVDSVFEAFEAPFSFRSHNDFIAQHGSVAADGAFELCVSTADRLLFLEAPAILAAGSGAEAAAKAELEILAFLSSVSHTLVVVVDAAFDAQVWKVLRLLAIIKGKVPDLGAWFENPGVGERSSEQACTAATSLPRLLFVFNQVDRYDFEAARSSVDAFLLHSPWCEASGVTFGHVPTLPGASIGARLLGEGARSAGAALRASLLAGGLGRGRFGCDEAQLTEGEWVRQLSAYLDFVRKAPFLDEYFRLLDRRLDNYSWPKF